MAKKQSLSDRVRKHSKAYDTAINVTADVMETVDRGIRSAHDTFFTDKDIKKANQQMNDVIFQHIDKQ